MTKFQFQFQLLVIFFTAIALIEGCVGYFIPELISETLRKTVELENKFFFENHEHHLIMVVFGAIFVFVAMVASILSLYKFKPWAPKAALICTLVWWFWMPFTGTSVQSWPIVILSELGSMSWGAILVLVYCSPCKHWFEKAQPEALAS